MNVLRTRVLLQMLLLGAGPLTAFTIGVRFMPGGVLPWLWYGCVMIVMALMALYMSGRVTQPLKQAIGAFRVLVKPDAGGLTRRWVPDEFWEIRDEVRSLVKDLKERNEQLEADQSVQARNIQVAEKAALRSLEVLHGLTETLKEGVVFIHNDGHVALINPAAEQMFAESERALELGMDGVMWLRQAASCFPGGEALAVEWEAWNSGPPALMQGEWVKGGTVPRVIAVKTFGVRCDQAGHLGRVWVFQDVTSERHITQRLKDTQKLESIGQLAGGIAHDFNNLLTAIRGSLALAQLEGMEARQQREHLENAAKAAARATELVGQILGYSRSKVSAARADVRQMVKELRNLLRASLDPRITLECRVSDDVWGAALPHVQLEQVVLNLCFNSRDALGDKGGAIQVFTSHFTKPRGKESDHPAAPGDYVVIHVKDNGSGIPESVQEHLFEPFFTTKAEGKGTGLGLATAYRIVDEAGGWIEFDTQEGKGTEFRIYLPRSTTTVVNHPRTEALLPRATMPLKAGSEEGVILVVDDEASVRSIAVSMLKYLGYKVLEAADGETALKMLSEQSAPLDGIMLDVHMPKMSGRETFKEMRKQGIEAPVIVCSGFTIEADEFKASTGEKGGSVSVIQKPYTIEKLAKVVSRAVKHGHSALPA
jgi:two-component system, cell cycle sensor histidine kinase and response regulator CckA